MTGADENAPVEFAPQVSATCKAGVMNIKVNFNNPYSGAIHARDYRKRECMQMGDGSNSIALSINLLAKQGQSDYCGVLAHNVSSEVSTEYPAFHFRAVASPSLYEPYERTIHGTTDSSAILANGRAFSAIGGTCSQNTGAGWR